MRLVVKGLSPLDGKPSKADQYILHVALKQGAGVPPEQVDAGGLPSGDEPVLTLGKEAMKPYMDSDKITEYHGHIHHDGRGYVCHTFDPLTVVKNANYLPLVSRHAANLMRAHKDPAVLDRPAVHFDFPPFLPEEAAIDLEWNKQGEVTVVGFATNEDTAFSTGDHGALTLAAAMLTAGKKVIGHNVISADLPKIGKPRSYSPQHVFDTMLAAHLVHAHFAQLGLLDLGSLVRFYFPAQDWKHDQYDLLTYNGYDCVYTFRLAKALERDLNITGQGHLLQHSQELEHLSGLMHAKGVAVDAGGLTQFVERRIEEKSAIKEKLPINPNSPKQVIEWAKKKGIRLTNCQADTLEKFRGRDAELDQVIDYRADNKNPSTWFRFETDRLGKVTDVDPFIYPRFHVTGTAVDRFSSSNPNFQNLPPEVRHLIVPRDPELELVAFDAAQAENRWVAWEAGDKQMMADFQSGLDIHNVIAGRLSSVLGRNVDRKTGKIVVHASNYGETHYNLARRMFNNLKDESLEQARKLQNAYFAAYPATRSWQKKIQRQLDTGDVKLVNAYGRVRFIYALDSHERMKRGLHFLGCSPSARTVNQRALDIYNTLGLVPILVVHDELVYELPKGETKLKRLIWDLLTQPIPQMGNLPGVWEMKIGQNYGKHSETNPHGLKEMTMQDYLSRAA